jgi:hypothetical protein
VTSGQERTCFRGDAALSILSGYLAFSGILTAAVLVMKFIVAIQALASALPGAW